MISQIADLISRPAFWYLLVVGFIYLAFMSYVDTLDAPKPTDSDRYRHFFKWANRFSMRAKRAELALHIPQVEDKEDGK